MTDTPQPPIDDNSPLAEAERELVASLRPGQAELIASWLNSYEFAWQAQRPTTGRAIRECFSYTAERLRILGNADAAIEKVDLPLSVRDAENLRSLLCKLGPDLMSELSESVEQRSAYAVAQSHACERIDAVVPETAEGLS